MIDINRANQDVPPSPGDDYEKQNTEELLEMEVTRLLYQQLPLNTMAAVGNGVIIVLVLWKAVAHMPLLIWFAVNALVALSRIVLLNFYRKRFANGESGNKKWLYWFAAGSLLAGLAFGSAGAFLFSSEFAYRVFVYFILGVMLAGSSGTYAIKRKIFLVYALPVFLPATVHFFLMGGDINLAMSGMGVLFFAVMMITVFRMHKVTVNSIKFTIRNNALIASLRKEKKQTELLNEELKEMSLKDTMTGLKNRRFFLEVIKPEAANYSSQLAYGEGNGEGRKFRLPGVYGIFLVDIDFFKRVNDTYGHDAGDIVLKSFGQLLTHEVREADLVVRWGGEEFLMVLRETGEEFLTAFSLRLREKIQDTPFPIGNGKTISITCSLGYVPYPFSTREPKALGVEDAITLADRALYYAKNNGRNLGVGIYPGECFHTNYKISDIDIDKTSAIFEQAQKDGCLRIDINGKVVPPKKKD